MSQRPGPLVSLLLMTALSLACGDGGGDGGGAPPNTVPVARAGRDLSAVLHARVVLDGSASSDADGDPLTYLWTVQSRPAGSAATIPAATGSTATLVADVPGTYTINLAVNDGHASSAVDAVTITALSATSHLPDTGLSRCFDASAEIACPAGAAAFSGQDAQVSTNPMQFTDGGATVTDAVTGLTWQKTDTTRTTWYQAAGVYDATYNPASIDVCGSLVLGGESDWRLPSRRELVSIMNYEQRAPDRSVFQQSGAYWSSSEHGPTAWMVAGGAASIGFGNKDSVLDVKCVRGTAWGLNGYTDNGDGTVTDVMSGLVWQQAADVVARDWATALSHCEGLTLAGSSDWRLPDVKELESLVAHASPSIDGAYFPATQPGSYWSSTTDPTNPGAAWSIDFYDGTVYEGVAKILFKFTRCVR